MKAVIMAGGKGTRLAGVAHDIPKPMVSVGEKPILEHQLECLIRSNIRDVTIIVGYLGEKIKNYFGDGSKWGVHISYLTEEFPLGTAGALAELREDLEEPFLLLFGDIMLDADFQRFYTYHLEKKSMATLFVHPNSHPFDSDLLQIDCDNRVIAWKSKKRGFDADYQNLVNAGVYVLAPEILSSLVVGQKADLERDVLVPNIQKGKPVFAYRSTEYVKDMGTPERLRSVETDLRSGICRTRNLSQLQRCIFLDRDGTINRLQGFLSHVEQMELLDGVAEAIAKINQSRFLCCVISNQPVIARGECSFETMAAIHNRMETLLGRQGAYIDRIYFCPHHPDKGFAGEVPALKVNCNCRKPKIGMLQRAAEELHIDLEASYFIGDSTVDLQTAKNAGMRGILVQTGERGNDGKYDAKPDAVYPDLLAAVSAIVKMEGPG